MDARFPRLNSGNSKAAERKPDLKLFDGNLVRRALLFWSPSLIWPVSSIHAKFLVAAASAGAFPHEGPPEFAFLGRSNVGKSSLINSMLGQKVAHVSSTPGRTRTINFIGIFDKPGRHAPAMMLVDLPGYGYAKLSRSITAEWPKFIEPYLKDRQTLKLAIVLIDANVPAQESDKQLVAFLRETGREFIVVGTKSDKLSGNKMRSVIALLERAHGVARILPYSARTGTGRNELWREIQSRRD